MTARARFSGILVVAALAALVGACGGGGTPNYLDTDSDGDGVPDRYEDRDGNGLIGDCTTSCVMQAMCPAGYTCALPADGASIGYCVAFECMDGETSPLVGDSDGDGTSDAQEGTFICNPGTETNPNGLKMFKTVDSVGAISYATPNWKVALELDALDGPVVVTNPTMLDSAYVFDLTDPAAAVAGFVVSRPVKVTESDAFVAAQLAAARLDALPNSITTLRASGTRNTSLDGYDSVFSTPVVFTSNGASDAVAVRERAVAAMLDRTPADVQLPPAGWTPAADTQFVVSFQSLHRADANQMLFMGAVARLSDFDDPARATGFHVDDMANGTALTHSGNGDTVECEQFLVSQTPKANIIWVVDESGSMSDDRANVAANATSFFNKATTAGLDFRMGVTDMNDATRRPFSSR